MKQKYAVGITVNGNEVRAAFLSLVRGKASIQVLESTKLDEPLESNQEAGQQGGSLNDLEKAFDIVEPHMDTEANEESPSTDTTASINSVSQIYSLLDRFQNFRTSVAINAPVLTVKYDTIAAESIPHDKRRKKKLKDRIEFWGSEDEKVRDTKYLNIAEDKVLQVDYEYHPPIVDVIEEVNQFRSGKLDLVLMDTNELALVGLVAEIYKLKKDEMTAVVYIEEDFSRIIFLKGKDIYHITPIIHKGSMSKDVLEVIYSRMIFAQDQHMIPELNKILVAGHSSKLKAKYYFRQKFPSAITGYLNSKKIHSNLRFKDRGLLFSRYAIPIALAWKALQKRVIKSKDTNFLPEYLLEKQRIPKFAIHGYLMFILNALTAFTFTWLIVSKNIEIKKVEGRVQSLKTQIDNNRSLTERVRTFDSQIIYLEKKIALVDSFSQGYDEMIELLNTLNREIQRSGNVWLTELKQQNKKVEIKGIAGRREKIPALAKALGEANLKKVTRSELHDTKVFTFQLDKKVESTGKKARSALFAYKNATNGNSQKKENPPDAQNRTQDIPKEASQTPKSSSNDASSNSANHVNAGYLYGLQVGGFPSKKEATLASQLYSSRGYSVVITQNRTGNKNSGEFSLIVGAYKQKQKAERVSQQFMSKAGIENQVVKFKKSD
ncbi:MAG: SPOR domain-containing protein [bacterium]